MFPFDFSALDLLLLAKTLVFVVMGGVLEELLLDHTIYRGIDTPRYPFVEGMII